MSTSRAIPSRGTTWTRGTTWGTTWVKPAARLAASLCLGLAVVAPVLVDAEPAAAGGNFDPTLTGEMLAERTGVDDAWAAGYTGAGIDIALIDTGVNAVGGLGDADKIVDGIDLSFDAGNPNLRFRDLHGHGTNMAGIIAAEPTAAFPLAQGVAPGARIVNVRVGAGDGAVDVSQVIAAIDWTVANRDADGMNIRVIALAYETDSTSDYEDDPLSHAVEQAWHHGIVVVAAGGNDGRDLGELGNPAKNPFVIAAGAASASRTGGWYVPSWTSRGDGTRNPDLLAPGNQIVGLRVPGSYLDTHYPQGRWVDPANGAIYFRGDGTSQAAAVLAGSAAILLEQRPELSPDDVKDLLVDTAVSVGRGTNVTRQGHGVLDLSAALSAEPTASPQNFTRSNGLGSLEAARGGESVTGIDGDVLSGELTAFGQPWSSSVWAPLSELGLAWNDSLLGSTWSGSTWSGSTWSGSTWSGSTWSGSTWSGSTWSGSTWSGSTWSGSTWSGSTWSGSTWSGAGWS